MWHVLTVLAAITVSGLANPYAFLAQPQMGGFYPPFPGGDVKQEKPLQLSCSATFSNGYDDHASSAVTDAIAANIKEKRGGFGSPYSPSFLNFGGLFGQHGSGGGLEAVFEIFSTSYHGTISLIVTEKGFVGDGCRPQNFGMGLTTGSQPGPGGGFGLSGGPGAGGYVGVGGPGAGGYVGVGGMGAGGHGGFAPGGGFGYGFASPSQFFAGKGGGFGPAEFLPGGVVAQFDVVKGTPKVISLDSLKDFNSLQQFAGRGLIACSDMEQNAYDGRAKCKGKILSCCALAYDQETRSINIGRGDY